MSRLKFIISLGVSISLILGQLSCINCTYASSIVELKESSTTRQRQGKNPVSVNLDFVQEIDIEKAEIKRFQKEFRDENKGKLNTFIRYGMASLALLASYMMLWNVAHTPQALSALRSYDPEDYQRVYNQQHSFTNSSAFKTLQFFVAAAAFGAMIKSLHTLWQVRDRFPSTKELKIKGKRASFDVFWTGMHSISNGVFRGLPKLCRLAQEKWATGEERAIYRPQNGSTVEENLPSWYIVIGLFLRLIGGKELYLTHRILKPVSDEFKEHSTHPPQAFSAKRLTVDLSGFKFCDRDFIYLISLNNIETLLLRNCHLTNNQAELLLLFAYSIENLDIRENPKISLSQLMDTTGGGIAPQNMRGALGFERLRTVTFDAREDFICEENALLNLGLPERRRIRVYGELRRKQELQDLFKRQFHYLNQEAINSSLPKELKEIMADNSKRNLPISYVVTAHGKEKIEYKRAIISFETTRQVLEHINRLNSKNVFYLIEYDNQNKPVLYISDPQQLQPSDDTLNVSTSLELKPFNSQYFRATDERVFGETLEKLPTLEDSIQFLEEYVLSSNSKGAYLIEYDAAGKQVFFCDNSLFQYHNKSNILFTASTICLPNTFKDKVDLRLFLRNMLKIYNIAEKSKLMQGEVVDISSFITLNLKDDFIILANELKHCSKRPTYPIADLDKKGLLTEVRLIETLTRCGFLKSLRFEVLDNSWY